MNKQIEVIALKHKDWVNITRSFGAKTNAEDIVQEMYLKLDRLIKPNQEISNAYVWITLRNLYFDFIKREPSTIDLDVNLSVSDELLNFEELRLQNEFNNALESKLNDCHWFDRKLFETYAHSGKSMRKLASETNISLSCIHYTINRVRDTLKQELEWLKEKQKD